MEQLILKHEIVDKIKQDPILFGKVTAALGLRIRTMSDLLPLNPPRLATASVLKVLRDHFGVAEDMQFLMESEEKVPV